MNDQAMQKPNLLITGCSGLIGSRLMEAFAPSFNVLGLDVKPPRAATHGMWIKCDLTEDDLVAQALEEVRAAAGSNFASVLHLAAYYDFSGKPSPLYRDLTVEGTRRLLRSLKGFHVEQFVFASSLLVMESADNRQERIDERSPVEAQWAYPRSKLEAEQVIQQEHGEIPAVVLRIAGVFDEDCHSLPLSQHIRRIDERQFESYFFPGDKTHGQPFIHLDDLAACFKQVVWHRDDLSRFELFLIAEDDLMSYAELQERLGELLHGAQWPTIRIPKSVAKAGAWAKDKLSSEEDRPFIKPWMIDLADQHYPVDVSRARARLNWEPKHTLRGTLPEMIERLRRDPHGWYQRQGLPLPQQYESKAAVGR